MLLDINECADNYGGCNQTCVNEIGSYHCDCGKGFLLNEDEHNCTGMIMFTKIFFNGSNVELSLFKISMSVTLKMVTVNMNVIIAMEAIVAAVLMGMI